jgi:hypothetical protein
MNEQDSEALKRDEVGQQVTISRYTHSFWNRSIFRSKITSGYSVCPAPGKQAGPSTNNNIEHLSLEFVINPACDLKAF